MTPLQRFVQYVIIANALLNLFTFINLKPVLARSFKESPLVAPSQICTKNPIKQSKEVGKKGFCGKQRRSPCKKFSLEHGDQ